MEMNRQEMTAFLEAWMTGDPEQDDAWLALQYGELFMTEKIIDLNMAVFQVLLNDVIRKNENLILAELDTGPLFDRLQDILRRSKVLRVTLYRPEAAGSFASFFDLPSNCFSSCRPFSSVYFASYFR